MASERSLTFYFVATLLTSNVHLDIQTIGNNGTAEKTSDKGLTPTAQCLSRCGIHKAEQAKTRSSSHSLSPKQVWDVSLERFQDFALSLILYKLWIQQNGQSYHLVKCLICWCPIEPRLTATSIITSINFENLRLNASRQIDWFIKAKLS